MVSLASAMHDLIKWGGMLGKGSVVIGHYHVLGILHTAPSLNFHQRSTLGPIF